MASLSSLDFPSFFESFAEVSAEEVLFPLVPSFGWPVSLCQTDPKNPSSLEDSDEDLVLEELSLLEEETESLICSNLPGFSHVHDPFSGFIIELVCKHFDNRALVGAEILRHGNLEFNLKISGFASSSL